MSTREQFEAWYAQRYGAVKPGDTWANASRADACEVWQAARAAALEEAAETALAKLKELTTEMEGYSYFGSNPGVKEDDYSDVADAIRALAKVEGEQP